MKRALAIYGPTGIGKTYEAVNRGYCLIRDINDLLLLGQKSRSCPYFIVENERLAFDDFNFRWRSPEELIHLGDSNPSTHRVLCNVVSIRNCDILLIHNDKSAFEPFLASSEQLRAIERRITPTECRTREHLHQILNEHDLRLR